MLLIPESEYVQCRKSDKLPLWPHDRSVEREHRLYNLAHQKYRATHSRKDVSESDPSSPETSRIEREVDQFPKSFRTRAKRLFTLLKSYHPSVDWTDQGEVIFAQHGTPYTGTNIIDLIHHATAPTLRAEPVGWKNFTSLLQEFNIPVTMLNKNTERILQPAPASPPPSKSPIPKLRLKKRAKRLKTSGEDVAWIRLD